MSELCIICDAIETPGNPLFFVAVGTDPKTFRAHENCLDDLEEKHLKTEDIKLKCGICGEPCTRQDKIVPSDPKRKVVDIYVCSNKTCVKQKKMVEEAMNRKKTKNPVLNSNKIETLNI